MKEITKKEIIEKIKLENPWWDSGLIDDYFKKMKPRAYLDKLYGLISKKQARRAVVLIGARRVGKTVLLYHAIQRLIDSGVDPKRICYVSMDAPVYIGCGLEKMLRYYMEILKSSGAKKCYVFFDEIQYLKNWEIHLKKLVDDYRDANFIASGSAAAALKLKSAESGAGRFTHLDLPALTFYEYLSMLEKLNLISEAPANNEMGISFTSPDIDMLNKEFVNYLNFGGYPEALFSEAIRADTGRYIRSDIIDKVLLRDLPGLYGIHDVQELNRLFTVLAYNSGGEVSLESLSRNSGVAKNTIKKYLEYLEAASLIAVLHRIDQSGRRFKRANFFKVYLSNPSIRCALFGPVRQDDEIIGNMAETAIINQWHYLAGICYARWKSGEVDLVSRTGSNELYCLEIKWSNRYFDRPEELKSLLEFARHHNLKRVKATTIDKTGVRAVADVMIQFEPASLTCFSLGLMKKFVDLA